MAELVMRKNLATTGLSMSQAQTVSNLAFQNAYAISSEMSLYNNVKKTIKYKGENMIQVRPMPVPDNIDSLLDKLGKYYAAQAFLMENIKCKDAWLTELRNAVYTPSEALAKEEPIYPTGLIKPNLNRLVDETWGWAQLSTTEMSEYWEAEAMAAHYGAFIHKGGKLDALRKQLPTIQTLEWHTTGGVNGDTYPITVDVHHKMEALTKLHNDLANKHKTFEQRVNFFKAMVKNKVTEENALRSKQNGITQAEANQKNNELLSQYHNDCKAYEGKRFVEEAEFEKKRQEDIKAVAALRINVDQRFQAVIDALMPKEDEVK